MAKVVIKKVATNASKTDIYYFCPYCDTFLWEKVYVTNTISGMCPKCKGSIIWSDSEE